MDRVPDALEIPLAQLIDISIESWYLRRWLLEHGDENSHAAIRHVVRKIDDILRVHGIESSDMTGQRYDPGLAVEVVDTLGDARLAEDVTVIEETIAPMILWNGKVIRHGQVIICSCKKQIQECAKESRDE